MNNKTRSTRRSLLTVALVAVVFVIALIFAPAFFSSRAVGRKIPQRNAIGNYDIRTDTKAADKLANFRARSNRSAAAVADMRDEFVRGENRLRGRIPSLKVEYGEALQNAEVIGPDPTIGRESLMGRSAGKRADVLRSFAKENASLVGVNYLQADVLKETADYSNPDGKLSFAALEQQVDGIPVFQGEIKAGFNKRGEMFRVINNLAPGLDYDSLSREFGNPADAVRAAAANISVDPTSIDLTANAAATDDLKTSFGTGGRASTAEKVYFPTEPGVAVPAWRVAVWDSQRAYFMIVDAESGAVLWRKNLTDDQTQPATYNVYAATNNLGKALDSPAPSNPSTLYPGNDGGASVLTFQPEPVGRTDVTLIGNEGPLSFNTFGWITDNTNGTNGLTQGNAVTAGLDVANPDGIDPGTIQAGTNRVFNFAYTPSAVTGATISPFSGTEVGDIPADAAYRSGIVTNLFYLTNRYHDALYQVGFTEAARNFQVNNFSRGGAGNDPVSAQAQDNSGFNNANFTTLPDGNAGIMQMYLFQNGSAPARDGSLDAAVVFHELTHGLSNRLVGNAAGLGSQQAGGMGEGWGDLVGFLLLAKPGDSPTGVYSSGGYVTYKMANSTFRQNYYYGIRRFPYAVKSATGGPNNRPYNPLTFADIDPSKINLSDGAYTFSPLVGSPLSASQVHNEGELWAVTGIEVWSRLVTRLGHAPGTLRTLQLYIDGMKLSPLNPTFLQERDALLSAAQAGGSGADVADIWAAFAARGMGFSASNPSGNTVVEAFDLPNLQQISPITISDPQGNNNGFPEPGEKVSLNVMLTNNTGQSATGVTAQLVGGGSANYGIITNGQTATQGLAYTIPIATACGSAIDITINVNSSIGPTSFTRSIIVGAPNQTFSENFDAVTVPTIPVGWTAASTLGGINFVTVSTSSDTAPNSAYVIDPANTAGGADLISPSLPITATAATLSFRHRYDTEPAWDGGVLEISIGGGAFSDILTAGGTFISNGYNGNMTAAPPSQGYTPNPLNGRSGWTGNSSGFITTIVRLPASAAGQNVRFKWRSGADSNTTGIGPNPGWYVDTIKVNGSYNCTVFNTPSRALFDFDGDGKADRSVFRPSGGQWYLDRSRDGMTAYQWGASTDKVVAADYDGDGITDPAVYRPSEGTWWWINSRDGTVGWNQWGASTDIPVPADYDGDGKADPAVYRGEGQWFVLKSTGGSSLRYWGYSTDIPVPADYDGGGVTDVAVYRPSNGTWWWINSRDETVGWNQWGDSTDKPVPADYDGDGKADPAVYRGEGQWWVLKSTGGYSLSYWGMSTDTPVPADYDGDGKTDPAVYRGDGQWFVLKSTGGFSLDYWGFSTDRPVPNAYIK